MAPKRAEHIICFHQPLPASQHAQDHSGELIQVSAEKAWLADNDQLQKEGLFTNDATDTTMEQDPGSAVSASSAENTRKTM